MFAVPFLLVFLQVPANPQRMEGSAVARNGNPVVYEPANANPHPQVQKAQAARFQARFNNLVKAIEEFSIAFNRNHGQVWPHEKAKALQKAMAELQEVDPQLSARK
ncbi:MAG: hypothetical protein NW208_06080 [Bryobacter sp.]|nr:hypothetical protein [Bryobacter sp.]